MKSATIAYEAAEVALFVLDLPPTDLAACHAVLDDGERERAARFARARDRDRFIARRGQLRAHLAGELGVAPQAVRIVIDAYGKPTLADDAGLSLNLSHSHGLALCATSREGPVGCDIEWRDPALACPRVAERLFARAELAALSALPPEQWVPGFFNCWTRKEAYVKALGLGLSYPLDAFSVSVAPGDAPCFTSNEPGWALSSFEPAPDYQAALVTVAGATSTAG